MVVGHRASNPIPENEFCCEISVKYSWLDIWETNYSTQNDEGYGTYYYVLEDFKKFKVKNWKEKDKDRGIWSDLAGKAKTHKGL
jgi:hypothetical protein